MEVALRNQLTNYVFLPQNLFAQLILLFLIPFRCPSLRTDAEILIKGQQHSRQTCPSTSIIVTYHEAVVKAVMRHLLASSRKQMGPFYLLLDLNSSVLDFYCEQNAVFPELDLITFSQ
jgi:hypothetical protein